MGDVEESITVADDGLGNEVFGLGDQSAHFLDGGADGHDFDKAAADLVNEYFHADDRIGPDLASFLVNMFQAVGPGLVNELSHGMDFAACQSGEKGADA